MDLLTIRSRTLLKLCALVALVGSPGILTAQTWHPGDTLKTTETDSTRIDPMRNNMLDVTGQQLIDAEFPRSWPIFGTNARMAIGGYVKLDYIQDLDGGYDRFQYEIQNVPVEGDGRPEQDGYMNMHARESRFNFDIRSIADGGMPLRIFIEMDFYNLDRGAFNQAPRLRHAYGVAGRLLVGRTWGTGSDLYAVPTTIDFAAGDALTGTRRAQVRFEDALNEKMNYAVALEMLEYPGIDGSGLAGQASQQLPLAVGRLTRTLKNGGRMMFAATAFQLRWDGTDSVPNADALGWGVSFTGREYFGKKHYFRWMASYGDGWGSNIVALVGTTGSATMTPEGVLQTMPAWNLGAGFCYNISPVLVTNINAAWFGIEPSERRDPWNIQAGGSGHVNLIWSPIKVLNVGGEFIMARRLNVNDTSGIGRRIQFMIKYLF